MKKSRFFVFVLIMLLLLGMLLVSCQPDNSPRIWTIMVWLDGDNNLERYAIKDLNEMEAGINEALKGDYGFESKVNVIVQVDRIAGYDETNDAWTGTRRYKVKSGSNTTTIESQLLQDMGEVNMGDATNLKDFIDYAKLNFPAKNYALLLWNHGGGVRSASNGAEKAVCWDDSSNGDTIYTGELTNVLTDNEDVSVLGFDACLMSMIEMAYEYRPLDNKWGADYMVASTNEIPTTGWDYLRIFKRLKGSGLDSEGDTCYDATNLTPALLGEIFVKEFRDFYTGTTNSISLLDLAISEDIKTNFDAFSANLVKEEAIVKALPFLYYFNNISLDSADLYDFLAKINNSASFNDIVKAQAQDLMSKVDTFIVSSMTSESGFVDGQNGIGILIPKSSTPPWYTNEDLSPTSMPYGNIDFCSDSPDSTTNTWHEVLLYWDAN